MYSTFICFIISISCIIFSAQAQSQPSSNSMHMFAPQYYISGGEYLVLNDTTFYLDRSLPISIIDKSSDSIIVFIDKNIQASPIVNRQISLSTESPLHLKFRDWDIEPLVVPIKIRPKIVDQPLEFVGEFTLGSYMGFQWGRKTIGSNETFTTASTIFIFGAPTMVRINPEVANTDNSNLTLGFSPGLGYTFGLSDFQLGFVVGTDFISGEVSKTWIYQGQLWYSFTIGFDFNDEEGK